LPINEMTSLDGQKKAEMVKKLHVSVRQHIEKKMSNMRPRPTRVVDKSSLNQAIGFGCI
jgi:hypothetical protein